MKEADYVLVSALTSVRGAVSILTGVTLPDFLGDWPKANLKDALVDLHEMALAMEERLSRRGNP